MPGGDEPLPVSIKKKLRQNMMDFVNIIEKRWKGRADFLSAQGQVVGVLLIAYIGNNWEPSYSRNDNHNMAMFWTMNIVLLVAALATMKHDAEGSARGVQLLSRSQTEEWKGWMQWAFIMYHYYRAYNVYNAIRVFVSAYVWMTGFGNFLYFDKKQDFSITRALSMWIRINYFPILLSVFVGVELDLFYIVPLHTTAFFITMATCYIAKLLERHYDWPIAKRNQVAIGACLLFHVVFYETALKNVLLLFSKEIHFRFQADKYSAPLGILAGYFWSTFKKGIQWSHIPENQDGSFTTDQMIARWGQRIGGVALIAVWWIVFGSISDKFIYNPIHPFIFWMPIAGWLMVRNSSKYLTEIHSTALEFFGRITLETYVLQFHVFMNHKVQHIPVVIPGATADGPWILKTLNMLLTGVGFVALAYWARKITVTTQTTSTELIVLLTTPQTEDDNEDIASEKRALTNGDDKTMKLEEGNKS